MEISIHVQVTTSTDISVAERAGGLSERLEMVSSFERVSVGTLRGCHSVALQNRCTENRIETVAASLTQTNAFTYTDKQLQQQQQWRGGGRAFYTVHWLVTGQSR